MAVNRGKQFEDVIRAAFEKIPNTSVVRLHDQTTGYIGSSNHCDFIVYHKPFEYHIECKSVHGNTLSIHSIPKPDKRGKLRGFYGDITDKQWEGLFEKSRIDGVFAGVICWWVDKDVTLYIPIELLNTHRSIGNKSVRYDFNLGSLVVGERLNLIRCINPIAITGKKKRVFFDYDMDDFFHQIEKQNRKTGGSKWQ